MQIKAIYICYQNIFFLKKRFFFADSDKKKEICPEILFTNLIYSPMKKVAIVIVLLSAFLIKTNAQEGLSYGPIVGIGMSSLNKNMTNKVSKYKTGYQVGANVNYRIIDLVSASFSAAYSKAGASDADVSYFAYDGESITDYKNIDITMHTIDLNLLANVHLPLSLGPVKPKVIVGIGNSYLLGAKVDKEIDGRYGVSTAKSTMDVKERFANSDFAAIGGIGVELEIFGLATSIDARYRAGFTDVNNVALKPKLYNSSFAVVLGVNF